jgi:hypothetical protein
MKYLKTYEENNTEPQIDEYVAIGLPRMIKSEWVINRNPKYFIGQIVDKKNIGKKGNIYKVLYDDTLDHYTKEWWVLKNEILKHSKNKRDLEFVDSISKYNI